MDRHKGNTVGDVAGEVFEVGSGVTRFKKGNRALEMPLGLGLSKPSEGGFQLYSIVHAVLAASVPDSMSYTEAPKIRGYLSPSKREVCCEIQWTGLITHARFLMTISSASGCMQGVDRMSSLSPMAFGHATLFDAVLPF